MRKFVLGFALACSVVAGQAQASGQARSLGHGLVRQVGHGEGYSRAAQRVLAQARTAAGGAGWNLLRGWHETGREGGVAYESWLDPLRYGMRVETREAGGLRVHGFNGGGDWQVQPGGATTGLDVTKAVSETRTEAFFRIHGYFYGGRFDARGEYLGVRTFRGRAYEVVEVKPWGCTARELWFDRRTHLLGRMVDRSGAAPVAVQVSDYRKVGPVLVAFRYAAEGASGPTRQVESLSFAPADRDMFSLPRSTVAEAQPATGPGGIP